MWAVAVEQARLKQGEDCNFTWYFSDGMKASILAFTPEESTIDTIFNGKIKDKGQREENQDIKSRIL